MKILLHWNQLSIENWRLRFTKLRLLVNVRSDVAWVLNRRRIYLRVCYKFLENGWLKKVFEPWQWYKIVADGRTGPRWHEIIRSKVDRNWCIVWQRRNDFGDGRRNSFKFVFAYKKTNFPSTATMFQCLLPFIIGKNSNRKEQLIVPSDGRKSWMCAPTTVFVSAAL